MTIDDVIATFGSVEKARAAILDIQSREGGRIFYELALLGLDSLAADPEREAKRDMRVMSSDGEFDGYKEACRILERCVAKFSVEQAREVGIVLRQWREKWQAAVDLINPATEPGAREGE